jgi:hypothetical protein
MMYSDARLAFRIAVTHCVDGRLLRDAELLADHVDNAHFVWALSVGIWYSNQLLTTFALKHLADPLEETGLDEIFAYAHIKKNVDGLQMLRKTFTQFDESQSDVVKQTLEGLEYYEGFLYDGFMIINSVGPLQATAIHYELCGSDSRSRRENMLPLLSGPNRVYSQETLLGKRFEIVNYGCKLWDQYEYKFEGGATCTTTLSVPSPTVPRGRIQLNFPVAATEPYVDIEQDFCYFCKVEAYIEYY